MGDKAASSSQEQALPEPRAAQNGNHEGRQAWETRLQRQPGADGDHEGGRAWETRRQRLPRFSLRSPCSFAFAHPPWPQVLVMVFEENRGSQVIFWGHDGVSALYCSDFFGGLTVSRYSITIFVFLLLC